MRQRRRMWTGPTVALRDLPQQDGEYSLVSESSVQSRPNCSLSAEFLAGASAAGARQVPMSIYLSRGSPRPGCSAQRCMHVATRAYTFSHAHTINTEQYILALDNTQNILVVADNNIGPVLLSLNNVYSVLVTCTCIVPVLFSLCPYYTHTLGANPNYVLHLQNLYQTLDHS